MEENYSVETSNIIALCHIIDEFKEFEKRLGGVISTKDNSLNCFMFCKMVKLMYM